MAHYSVLRTKIKRSRRSNEEISGTMKARLRRPAAVFLSLRVTDIVVTQATRTMWN